MKKLLLILLFLPLFAKAQQPVPIDSSHYAARGIVITKFQGDSLASLMVRFSGSYSNPSWLNSIAWGKITGAPTVYNFTGSTAQYTRGDGTYATFPTNVSTFTNDSGYQTATSIHNALSKSANYSIVSTDFASGKPPILHLWVDCTSGSLTATLPSASTFAGYIVVIGKTDATANVLTISGCAYDNKMNIQNSVKEFYSNASTWLQN